MNEAKLIRCTIERAGGSHVTIDSTAYHFKPRPDLGAPTQHVAPVSKKQHINRLLEISEAYELFLGEDAADEDGKTVGSVVEVSTEPHLGVGTVPHPSIAEHPVADGTVEPGDAAQAAASTATASQPDPTEPPSNAAEADAPENPPEGPEDAGLYAKSDDELRAIFKTLNGRAAAANAKRETLIKKIQELEAAKG